MEYAKMTGGRISIKSASAFAERTLYRKIKEYNL